MQTDGQSKDIRLFFYKKSLKTKSKLKTLTAERRRRTNANIKHKRIYKRKIA